MYYFISRPCTPVVATATLLVRLLLLQCIALLACAEHIVTKKTTLTITSTVLTSTTTITLGRSTFASTTTETSQVGATVITQPATTATATTGSQATSMATFGQALQNAVLNSTNYYRAQHQAKALSWNGDLAKYAANYSSGCIWQHSGGPYGENLAAGYPSVATAIDAWADEEEHYDYEKPKFSEETGHFTQLVWQNTTSVGCGLVDCKSDKSDGVHGMYLVCEYEPRGNVAGQYRAEVRKPGEGSDGEPGLGAAAGFDLSKAKVLRALAAACVVLAILS